MKEAASNPAIRISLIYLFFAGLWILLSDRILDGMVNNVHVLSQLQTYKGWAFVLASAGLIYFLLAREILHRDQVEESRRQSEERYRRLIEQASDGIFITDFQGNFLEINPSGCAMLGYEREELIGLNSYSLIPPEELEVSPPAMNEIREGKISLREREFRRKDGSLLPVEISARLLDNQRVQGIMRDISERKLAEARLQRQMQRLSALRTIDIAINATLDQRVTFSVLLDQVLSLLGVDAVAVLLFNPLTQRLEYAASRGFKTAGISKLSLMLGEGLAGRVAQEREALSFPDLSLADVSILSQTILADEGFKTYNGVPLIAKGQLKGVLETFHRSIFVSDEEWLSFLEGLAGQAAIAIDNASLYEKLQRSSDELAVAYDATLEGWSRALELRDRETQGHSRRVTELTLLLAHKMGITNEEDLINMRRGTLLHDIGKMGVPDSILLKPGPLDANEWEIMRRHPVYAFEMLSSIPFLIPAIDIPYCHHERWDGSGYPRGLKGVQIPIAARLFSVVDVWDALSSNRPYRAAWPGEKVIQYIRENAELLFDPLVVEVFLKMIAKESEASRFSLKN